MTRSTGIHMLAVRAKVGYGEVNAYIVALIQKDLSFRPKKKNHV